MKLNKLQRHTAYIIMLSKYEADVKNNACYSQGFCYTIKELFTDQTEDDPWENNVEWFPELMKHKPKETDFSGSWFNVDNEGRKKRIEILKQAIAETY